MGSSIYGSWGFLRYLTDEVDNDVVKLAWEYADAAPGASGRILARRAATRRCKTTEHRSRRRSATSGLPFTSLRRSSVKAPAFPSASVDTFELNRRGDSTRWRRYLLDHLAYAPITLRPGDRLSAGDKVRISVDAPSIATHPQARAMVVFRDGTYGSPRSIDLNDRGNGAITLPFGAR